MSFEANIKLKHVVFTLTEPKNDKEKDIKNKLTEFIYRAVD